MAKKQEDLPGMSDRKLKDLSDAAEEYADIRDQRMALSSQEVPLKEKLINLMHKHKKDHYEYDGISIELVVEKEKVRVKIRGKEEEEAAAAAGE